MRRELIVTADDPTLISRIGKTHTKTLPDEKIGMPLKKSQLYLREFICHIHPPPSHGPIADWWGVGENSRIPFVSFDCRHHCAVNLKTKLDEPKAAHKSLLVTDRVWR